MLSPSAMAAAVDPRWEDEEEEEEEEEIEVFILGIDTERPILQVDSYVFAGEYEDTLGTCVIFEEGVERVEPEGTEKTVLKYKCHTMKKLSMTRTLLTEKKEGEENIDGVEWLQMKDNDFSYRPNMICSFLHEHDDEAGGQASDKPVELEDQESHTKGGAEQEGAQHSEAGEPGLAGDIPSEMESSLVMGTQEGSVSQNDPL
ncbi:General transcription factor 3C polypeptide 6 [Apodemus speciosus]|uniref:General transcription factor 3C polypeptide 6 n=1 Tax=Apodemus speciosus TaxID=105296 RepID=A0ABQ0F7M5_APOSI